MFGIGYCWQHFEVKRHLRIGPLLITRPKTDRAGNVVKDVRGHIIKEPIGRGVFVDDPKKNTNPYTLKASKRTYTRGGTILEILLQPLS